MENQTWTALGSVNDQGADHLVKGIYLRIAMKDLRQTVSAIYRCALRRKSEGGMSSIRWNTSRVLTPLPLLDLIFYLSNVFTSLPLTCSI
jgi:hypothetical protein